MHKYDAVNSHIPLDKAENITFNPLNV